jgi:hypothetical protein
MLRFLGHLQIEALSMANPKGCLSATAKGRWLGATLAGPRLALLAEHNNDSDGEIK